MYPNDDNPPAPIPADYLNQIAPNIQKSKIDFLKKKPILIGLIVLASVFAIMIFVMISNSISGISAPTKTLYQRLVSTQITEKSASRNIKDSKLRALNSSLGIYLTNSIRDFTPIMALSNITPKNIDKNIIASESNTSMLATLEDARLNAIYDRIYAREMTYQLEKTLSLMNQIYQSSNNTKTKNFLNNAHKNLVPIQKQFAEFNAPNS